MRITTPIVVHEFTKATQRHGIPYSTLTDNGMAFTTRLADGRGGRNRFERELRRLDVHQIKSTPNQPRRRCQFCRLDQPAALALRQ